MSVNTDNLDLFVIKGNKIFYDSTSPDGKTLREIVSENEGKVGRLFDNSKIYEKGTLVIDSEKVYKANKELASVLSTDFDEVIFSSSSQALKYKIIQVDVSNDTFQEFGDTSRMVTTLTKVADGNYTVEMDTPMAAEDVLFADNLEDANQTFHTYPFIWKKTPTLLEVRITKEGTADTKIQNNFQIILNYL